jgi:hypothetical protein
VFEPGQPDKYSQFYVYGIVFDCMTRDVYANHSGSLPYVRMCVRKVGDAYCIPKPQVSSVTIIQTREDDQEGRLPVLVSF